jgi:hypothetical protein
VFSKSISAINTEFSFLPAGLQMSGKLFLGAHGTAGADLLRLFDPNLGSRTYDLPESLVGTFILGSHLQPEEESFFGEGAEALEKPEGTSVLFVAGSYDVLSLPTDVGRTFDRYAHEVGFVVQKDASHFGWTDLQFVASPKVFATDKHGDDQQAFSLVYVNAFINGASNNSPFVPVSMIASIWGDLFQTR